MYAQNPSHLAASETAIQVPLITNATWPTKRA